MSRRIMFVVLSVLIAATLACGALGGGGGGTAPAATSGSGGAQATSGAGGSTGTGVRSANISEIQNTVEAQESDSAEWQAAGTGQQIPAGGGVRTGDASRARLDIAPDTTVLRIAPNTEFRLETLSPAPADPVTRFVLAAGKLFAQVTKNLGGGSFEVETPSGVATVRGSLMSAAYETGSGQMVATCLEGQCRLSRPGGAFTDMIEGQASEIAGPGIDPSPARLMTVAELDDWAIEFPETQPIVDRLKGLLPTPTPAGSGGLTACDHPYFPMRSGASWTYTTSSGTMTWSITSVTGDTNSAAAVMIADISTTSGGITVTYNWQCDAGGLNSYDFGQLSTSQFGQIASYELGDHSGTFLPPADVLVPGYSWTNTYTMKMSFTAPGAENMAGTTSVSDTYSVTGAEPVTFGGQTYDGLQISESGSTDTQITLSGVEAPATHIDSTGAFVLARGVGIVHWTSTSAGSTNTTDLVSFNVP